MDQYSNITYWFLLTTVIAVAIYDLWVGTNYGGAYTVSTRILQVSRVYPILPLAFGAVLGHLFWPQQ